jgi:hypothetical protein
VTAAGCALVAVAVGVLAATVALCAARVRRLDRLHVRLDAARAGLASALERRSRAALAAAAALEAAAPPVPPGPAEPAAAAARPGGPAPARASGRPAAPVPARPTAADPGRAPEHPAAEAEPGTAPTPTPAALRRAATTARRAAALPLPDREVAENALGRHLAALDRDPLPAAVQADLVDAEQLVVLARHVHNDAVRDTLGLRSRRLVRWLRLAGTAPHPVYFEIADPGVSPGSGRSVGAPG